MKTSTKNIIYISLGVISLIALSSFLVLRKRKKTYNVLLLGGLDNRGGDLKIAEQEKLLQKGLGEKYNIESFRYNDSKGILKKIEDSKKEMFVVLFSAGGSSADKIAEKLKDKKFNLNKLYIVEAWGKEGRTKNNILKAVDLGVPQKNLIVGKSSSTGKGIVSNPTPTPSCSPSHWCSLTEVGKIIKEKK
jgi:LPXTG-motif cell wall-anchored protein